MAKETTVFEGPSAATDAATLVTKYPGAAVAHEGVIFIVEYDPANAPHTAAANVGTGTVAAAIEAAKARKA